MAFQSQFTVEISVPTFVVNGPFEVPAYRGRAARTISSEEARRFWDAHSDFGSRRGCYLFGIRSGGGITPIYVGKATRGFRQEVFAPHKITKYQQALADYGRGTPILLFLTAPRSRGAPNRGAIEELEEFLIQTAVSQNPELLNVKGTRRAEWAIAGVLRSGVGRPSAAARLLKTMLDI